MPRPAQDYADLLMKRIEDFGSQVYLINTGWTGGSGGANGKGSRFPIPVTRAVVAAAQSGALLNVETKHIDALNLDFPVSIPGVADEFIDPKASWGMTRRTMHKRSSWLGFSLPTFKSSISAKISWRPVLPASRY